MPIDPGRMPAVILVIIAKGAAAIGIGLGNLIADDGTDHGTDNGANRLVTASRNHIAGDAAYGGAPDCCDHPVERWRSQLCWAEALIGIKAVAAMQADEKYICPCRVLLEGADALYGDNSSKAPSYGGGHCSRIVPVGEWFEQFEQNRATPRLLRLMRQHASNRECQISGGCETLG